MIGYTLHVVIIGTLIYSFTDAEDVNIDKYLKNRITKRSKREILNKTVKR